MKITQLIPETTGWVATYKIKNDENAELQFIAILGWGLTDGGEVVALVPSTDGKAVFSQFYTGMDGELTFNSLMCGCGHDEDGGE